MSVHLAHQRESQILPVAVVRRRDNGNAAILNKGKQRWSHFLRQPVKVDLTMRRTIHHEDAETIFG